MGERPDPSVAGRSGGGGTVGRVRRVRRTTLVAVALVLVGSACAGGSPPAAGPPASGTGPSATPAPAGEPGTTEAAGRHGAGSTPGTTPPVARPDQAFPDLGDPELDVQHYDLDLDYDVARRTLRGKATITATVLAPTDSVRLDLRGLEVAGVQVDGADAPHEQTDRAVEITLPERTPPGEEFRVVVDYAGVPAPVPTAALDGVEVGWHASSAGSFVVAEPEGASTWFPVNNHPRDKATYDIEVTVPEPFVAVASGRLAGTQDARAGEGGATRRTYHWVMDRPMANYLATVVTGRFEEQRLGEHGGVDYSNWLPADTGGEGGPFLGLDLVVDQLAAVLGPYPFSTYGAVVYPSSFVTGTARTKRFLSGVALEAQGRSLYGEEAISGVTVAHETAHQWMGDSVSLTDWSNDIWWVEGFAKYAETLDAPATERVRGFAADYAEVAPQWIPPAALPREELFSYGSYTEGSIVFYALEREVGRDTFTRILQTFTSRYRYGNATTADLVAVASEVSGRDLQSFFDGWLYAKKPPPFPR